MMRRVLVRVMQFKTYIKGMHRESTIIAKLLSNKGGFRIKTPSE